MHCIGFKTEAELLDIFATTIRQCYQIISKTDYWLSATPDGFTFDNRTPIEIKASVNKNTRQAIQ